MVWLREPIYLLERANVLHKKLATHVQLARAENERVH